MNQINRNPFLSPSTESHSFPWPPSAIKILEIHLLSQWSCLGCRREIKACLDFNLNKINPEDRCLILFQWLSEVFYHLYVINLIRSHYGFEEAEDALVWNLPPRVRTWLSLQLGSWLEEAQLLIHSTPNNSHFQTLQHWCPAVFVIFQQ